MSKSLLQRWFGRADKEQSLAAAIAHKGEGDVLLGRGDYAGAEACYRRAIAAAPGLASAHTNLGYALQAQERASEAAEAARQALAQDEAQPDTHYLAATLASAAGRTDDALRHYRRALNYAPGMDAASLELCTLLAGQKRMGEAVTVIEAALTHQPDHAQLHLYLGNLRQELGQYDAAIDVYRVALEREPQSPALLNNLGLALLKQGNAACLDQAVAVFERLLELAPESADVHNNLGHARQRSGDHANAVASFERALALSPGLAQARVNLGNTLFAQGKAEPAAAQFEQALSIDPELADAHFGLGAALERLERSQEASEQYRVTLDLAPGHTEALQRRGYLLQQRGELDEALSCYRQVLAQQPDSTDALFNSGAALRSLAETGDTPFRREKIEEAKAAYRAVLEIDPGHINALNNLAVLIQEQEDFAGSIALFEKMLAIDPQSVSARHNLGVSFESWGRRSSVAEKLARFELAIPHYNTAIALDPQHVDSFMGIAAIKGEQMQLDCALAQYDHILAIDPELASARMNRGMLLLSLGRFAEGWRDFEYRWGHNMKLVRLESEQPHWSAGVDLAGKTLLLYAEQGLGDNLQFVRYASLLAERGATVWVSVPPPLKLLFANCPGVARVFSRDDTIPPYDYLCPMLSVPGLVGTELDTIPARIPYLKAAPERIAHWRHKLGLHPDPGRARHDGLRVGLVWAGDPRKDQPDVALVDRMRSLHFDQLRPLLDVPGVSFYSLQVGLDAAAQLTGTPQVIDHTGELFDFQETAALAENLDLAICADTSTAHLVGAIGKPVWLLNRYNTCWRWLLDRKDSPWYPTMRLFRQLKLGDWDSVIAEVKAALEAEARKAGQGSESS